MLSRDIVEDHAYFARRAREERDRAAACTDHAAALVHLKLAEEYNKRAEEPVANPQLTPS